MLSVQDNEKLTRVGPGTPMGELLRRYWYPIGGTEELKEHGTKRVKILDESLVLYRDRSGRLGLIDDTCPHRRVNLLFGIPEQDGLRCPYHGWKFSAEGRCLEQPAEPPQSTFKDRVQIKAYAVEELAGLIWAYLGPKPVPLLPRWDLLVQPGVLREAGWTMIPCNWLQCMENSLDPVHVEWLHGHFDQYVAERLGRTERNSIFKHEKIGFSVFEHGIIKRRVVEGGSEEDDDWKAGHPVLFPHILRSGLSGSDGALQCRVPVDDTHTYQVVLKAWSPGEGVEVPDQDVIPFFPVPLPSLSGDGQPPWEVLDNNSGQDMAMWFTQGPIADRTMEKLGESDVGIIMYRKMLEEQLQRIARGEDPMNVFRDPAKNVLIELPHEERSRRGGLRRVTRQERRRGNVGKYSRLSQQIDVLFEKAAKLEEEKESAGGVRP